MNVTELIARLRGFADSQPTSAECADALEAQAREIAELRGDRDAAERGHDAAHAACVKYQDQVDALESRLAAAERERDSWRREAEANAEDAAHCGLYAHRLAVALDLLRQHGIHVDEKWCWCEPTVEDHREG